MSLDIQIFNIDFKKETYLIILGWQVMFNKHQQNWYVFQIKYLHGTQE